MANYTPRRAAGSGSSSRRTSSDRSGSTRSTRSSDTTGRSTRYSNSSYASRDSQYDDLEPLYQRERPRREAAPARERSSSRERQYSRDPQFSQNSRSRRRKSGPPLLPIVALVLLVVVALVIFFFVTRGCSSQAEKDPAGNGSSLSSAGSTVSETSGPTGEPTSDTGSAVSGETSQVTSSQPESSPTPAPQEEPQAAPETIGGLLIVGDTAYEYYNFSTDLANRYIEAVAGAGEKLSGISNVYDMVIPTSIDIDLPESYIEKNQLNTSDQRKAIEEYIYPSINAMNSSVKTISLFDTLKSHAGEYLYFRTDHHWTQLGAYYAYEQFCKAKGMEAVPLDQFEKKEYTDYLGSFYDSSQSSALASNPDTVVAYIPQADVRLDATQDDGTVLEDWPLIADGDTYSQSMKYIIYAAGDQPYEEITNSGLSDGSACILVKESFGNCFIPFLVNHYEKVYVVDYRKYQGTVSALAQEKGVEDVILLNNISMTRNEGLIDQFTNIF